MFDQMLGNEVFKNRLAEWIKGNCLPQAVLIEAEEGLGKHLAARMLAAAAECTGEMVPCGVCQGCRLSMTDGHPDVRFYGPEKGKSVFSVDIAREIRSQAYLKPMVGKVSVAVLEHAERMNAEAQNALLKILEEPPADAMFILLTENAGAMLTTVLSRCTLVRLSPVSADQVVDYLTAHTDCEASDAFGAAALADGNIGRAQMLLGDEKTAEWKALADRWYRGVLTGDRLDLCKVALVTEKSDARDDILKLLAERLAGDLRVAAKAGDTKKTALFTEAVTAVNDCRNRLAASGNKALCLTALCLALTR